MKHLLNRWRSSVDSKRLQRPAMFAAGLALIAGTVGGPFAIQAAHDDQHTTAPTTAVTVPHPADKPGDKPADDGDKPTAKPADTGGKPADKTVSTPKKRGAEKAAPSAAQPKFSYQEQSTYYFCAPAATRIALSAMGHERSQHDLARQLGTTESGTDSAYETTRVLNKVSGTDFYRTREIPGPAAKPAEMDRLQADTVRALSMGHPIVANIKGTAFDVDGKAHSYEGGHYLTIVGYRDQGRTVQIADPYDTSNGGTYWMSTISMANWIAERGYSG